MIRMHIRYLPLPLFDQRLIRSDRGVYLYCISNVAKNPLRRKRKRAMILSIPCANSGDRVGREKEKARILIQLWDYVSTLYSEF